MTKHIFNWVGTKRGENCKSRTIIGGREEAISQTLTAKVLKTERKQEKKITHDLKFQIRNKINKKYSSFMNNYQNPQGKNNKIPYLGLIES